MRAEIQARILFILQTDCPASYQLNSRWSPVAYTYAATQNIDTDTKQFRQSLKSFFIDDDKLSNLTDLQLLDVYECVVRRCYTQR